MSERLSVLDLRSLSSVDSSTVRGFMSTVNSRGSGVLLSRIDEASGQPVLLGDALNRVQAVALHTICDHHNHPGIYGMVKAAVPIWLSETDSKELILAKIKQRAEEGPDGPIIAGTYGMNAGITNKDLDGLGLNRSILLMSTSLHGGVATSDILGELDKRHTDTAIPGELSSNGEITEFYFWNALGIIEEQMMDRLVDGIVSWTLERIYEGTTTIIERSIITKSEWEALKQAIPRLKEIIGYNPIPEVYFLYDTFRYDLGRCAQEARDLGILPGVKWVGDGGTTTQTAALEHYSFTHPLHPKGLPTMIPINYSDPEAVQTYLKELKVAGIRDMTFHAIGDKTIGIALSLAQIILDAKINLTIAHFELPTSKQIHHAAVLAWSGLQIDMEPPYNSEAPRYNGVLDHLVKFNNPIGLVILELKRVELVPSAYLRFGTDGMPNHQLFSLLAAMGHQVPENRVTASEFYASASDRRFLSDGFVLVDARAYKSLLDSAVNPDVAANLFTNMNRTVVDLQESVLAVAANNRVLYEKPGFNLCPR
ncbi:MAG: hypothetical protein ABIJ10_03430 [Candidatus Micrarchaeota archaeon]